MRLISYDTTICRISSKWPNCKQGSYVAELWRLISAELLSRCASVCGWSPPRGIKGHSASKLGGRDLSRTHGVNIDNVPYAGLISAALSVCRERDARPWECLRRLKERGVLP